MNRYEIRCTKRQTKKALKLGAPIEELDNEEYMEARRSSCRGSGLSVFGSFEDYLNKKEYPNIVVVGAKGVRFAYVIPTAEQMIGWLEEQGNHLLLVDITETSMGIWSFRLLYKRNNILGFDEDNRGYHSRKEATLAAIDAALEYLSKKG